MSYAANSEILCLFESFVGGVYLTLFILCLCYPSMDTSQNSKETTKPCVGVRKYSDAYKRSPTFDVYQEHTDTVRVNDIEIEKNAASNSNGIKNGGGN